MSKSPSVASKSRSLAQKLRTSALNRWRKATPSQLLKSGTSQESPPKPIAAPSASDLLQTQKNTQKCKDYAKLRLKQEREARKATQDTLTELGTRIKVLQQQNEWLDIQNSAMIATVSQLSKRSGVLKWKLDVELDKSTRKDAKLQDLLEDLKACRAQTSSL